MTGTACAVCLVLLFGASNESYANPLKKSKFLFGDGFSEKITTFDVQSPQSQQGQQGQQGQPSQPNQPQNTMMMGYPIRFVSLISIFAGLLNTLLVKLGQVKEAIDKLPSKNSMNGNLSEEIVAEEALEDEENAEGETDDDDKAQLLECDANHLGLWPDKSNGQRYYKCEVDPRTPSLGNCIQDYFRERKDNKTNSETIQQGTFVPLVKPCFMLTIMKCANGYKYSHKTRICIPDVIFN